MIPRSGPRDSDVLALCGVIAFCVIPAVVIYVRRRR